MLVRVASAETIVVAHVLESLDVVFDSQLSLFRQGSAPFTRKSHHAFRLRAIACVAHSAERARSWRESDEGASRTCLVRSIRLLVSDHGGHAHGFGRGDPDREAALARWNGARNRVSRQRRTRADAPSAVAAWMRSPGHRANILAGGYSETGVVLAPDARGRLIFVQTFGAPE
ncbi:MAG: hypothetical protein DMD26_03910 [Gemmatimonadetes bacterium]|nr:MAG: hypothetical protein DMD26_03910 [Gemmatimonadota bacterium]